MTIVKTSSKGQLVIPHEIREKYGIKPGSFVYVSDGGKEIILTPAPSNLISAACGFLKGGKNLSKELIKERKKEANNEKKKNSR